MKYINRTGVETQELFRRGCTGRDQEMKYRSVLVRKCRKMYRNGSAAGEEVYGKGEVRVLILTQVGLPHGKRHENTGQ